jgi:hypothetical protein
MTPIVPGLFLVIALALSAQDSPWPKQLRVPDAATAIAIARPAAIHVYGRKQIDCEDPLTASIEKRVWSVFGTLCCPDSRGKRTCEFGRCLGGVVIVRIPQEVGRILSFTHGK